MTTVFDKGFWALLVAIMVGFAIYRAVIGDWTQFGIDAAVAVGALANFRVER